MANVKDSVTGSISFQRRATDQAAVLARIESLPKRLRPFVATDCLLPDLSRRQFIERAQQAQQLAEAIGAEFRVRFNPGSSFEDDVDATGNLFSVFLDPAFADGMLDEMVVDAREPHLRGQLAAEMRRVASLYIGAAVRLESVLPGDEKGGAA